ncbi:sensor histidine kinase [Telluribacter humicola]|uniref:sensor histidine kinase n=1 Tax=Telluribacter humicola TaxID=1720261 RepID=UPI001A96663D|nr:sensor histidine kinase [Telluribacter humicola]
MIDPEQIRWAILIAMLAMLMMAVFVITFVILYQKRQLAQEKNLREMEKEYQLKLLETALNSEESERKRIAQDLHDDIGTMLSLTKLSLNQLMKIINKDEPQTEYTANKVQSLLEETILHVRRITRELVPTTLKQFGLPTAIDEFVQKLDANHSISIHFNCIFENIPRQSQKVELTLYRIMQELVNNALKHSNGDEIVVDLHMEMGKIELQVTDNGKGFDAKAMKESKKAGLGLHSIDSRLSVVYGTVSYLTPGAKGCRVKVQVPVEPEKANKAEPLHPFRKSA